MKRNYLDSGVLLAAFSGKGELGLRALQLLDDAGQRPVVSEAVRLELFPKAVYEKRSEEVEFYRAIFAQAEVLPWCPQTLGQAQVLAERYGIAAMDAIHVAYAVAARVDALITTEKTGRPMFRVSEITIHTLQAEPSSP